MVANSDKPLNAKDHVEKDVAHQHDASKTLRESVLHVPFAEQHDVQKAALKANESHERPKPKGVEAEVDQYGHVIGNTIKLPGGDTYETKDGGKTWVWNTVKDGKECQFKINGFKDAVIDSEGNFTMRFNDGRKHTVDKDGHYSEVNTTVKLTYADGSPSRMLSADEAPKDLPTGVSRQTIERDRLTGQILSITDDQKGTTTLSYVGDELAQISYPDGTSLRKLPGNNWAKVNADGQASVCDKTVSYNQDTADFAMIERPKVADVPDGGITAEGDPTISVDRIAKEIHTRNKSLSEKRVAELAQFIYDEGVKHHINPAVALAFFNMETNSGTSNLAQDGKGWANIRGHASAGSVGGFRAYKSEEEGIVDWYKLISKYPDRFGAKTIAQIIHHYAPNSDGNNEAQYVATVEKMVKDWANS